MKKGKALRIISLPFALLFFMLLFALNFAYILSALVLLSAGLLTIPAGVIAGVGFITVASDLSPWALIFAGAFCLFAGGAMGLSLSYICTGSAITLHKYLRWYRPYEKQGSLAVNHSRRVKRHMTRLFVLCGISLALCAATQLIAVQSGFKSTFLSDRMEFDRVNYITVNTTNLDLTVKMYGGDKIVAEYENDSPIIADLSDNSRLKLTQSDDFTLSLFSLKMFSYKLTLYIPEGEYRELVFSSISGDITAEKLNAEYLELTTKSGSITAEQVDCKLKTLTESGKTTLMFAEFRSTANIQSGSGDISAAIPAGAAVKLDFITDRGTFTSDIFERKFNGRIGDVLETRGSDPHSLNVTSGTGSLEIYEY